MSGRGVDRRVQKTFRNLEDGLTALIAEKQYDEITVQEILDRANVGRSTFYAHFENKDQLLRNLLIRLNEKFEEGIAELAANRKSLTGNSDRMPLRLLQFVRKNHRLFNAMLVDQQHSAGSRLFHDYLLQLTREHVRMMLEDERHDAHVLELAAHYFAGAFIGALVWWLENDMADSEEEFARMINQFTLPGMKEVFGT